MSKVAAKSEKESLLRPDVVAFRDAALVGLKVNMDLCVEMLNNSDLAMSVKIKWAHCLAQTAGVLCNIIKSMGKIQDVRDEKVLAKLIPEIRELEEEIRKAGRMPKRFRRCGVDYVRNRACRVERTLRKRLYNE
ncbi:MAG: hypothetical protein ACE5IF_02835 [Candidatus Bathyarchaeia archaeon]